MQFFYIYKIDMYMCEKLSLGDLNLALAPHSPQKFYTCEVTITTEEHGGMQLLLL